MRPFENPEGSGASERRRYTWPWFVLAGVILAILLAIAWVSREVSRTKRLRQVNSPALLVVSKH